VRLIGGGKVDLSKEPEAPQPEHQDKGGGIPWVVVAFILVWIIFGRGFWPLFFLGGMSRRGGFGGGGFGGGGGGGFGGGGGSFGGGGASGSW
jgi:uncharacterized protein